VKKTISLAKAQSSQRITRLSSWRALRLGEGL
jgi:hypothetical protein